MNTVLVLEWLEEQSVQRLFLEELVAKKEPKYDVLIFFGSPETFVGIEEWANSQCETESVRVFFGGNLELNDKLLSILLGLSAYPGADLEFSVEIDSSKGKRASREIEYLAARAGAAFASAASGLDTKSIETVMASMDTLFREWLSEVPAKHRKSVKRLKSSLTFSMGSLLEILSREDNRVVSELEKEELSQQLVLRWFPEPLKKLDRAPSLVKSNPHFRRLRKWLVNGQRARDEFDTELRYGRFPTIICWYCSYLLNKANIAHGSSEWEAALSLGLRAVELYSVAVGLSAGKFEIGRRGKVLVGGAVPSGMMDVYREALRLVNCDRREPEFARVESIIRMRNKSLFGHGLQKGNKGFSEKGLSDIYEVLVMMDKARSAERSNLIPIIRLGNDAFPDHSDLAQVIACYLEFDGIRGDSSR